MSNDQANTEQSSAELSALETLRRRERELSDFVENASVGLHWVGADGIILWANQAELSLLGYTKEEYVGRHIAEFHADNDVINDILNRLTNKETLHNHEAQLKCKDGSIRHVLINSNVMWDGDEFVHTRCFTRDITERKLAEDELHKSRRQLETVFNNATVAHFMLDEHHHCTYMNPAAEKLTGYTLAEVQGRSLHYFVHHTRPDGSPYPLEECPIDRALPQNNQVQGEEVLVHKDGSFYPIAFTASPIREEGRPVGTIIEVRDITREKQALEERQTLLSGERRARAEAEEQRDFTHHVLEHAPLAIGVMEGPEHRFVLVNQVTCDLTGLAKEQLLGRTHAEAVPAADTVVGPILDRVYTTGLSQTEEIEIDLAKGRRQLLVTWMALPGRDNRPGSVLYLSLDITARKRAEEAVRDSERQLHTLADAVSQLVWMAEPDGHIFWYNQRWYDYTGTTPAQMEGWGWQSVHDPEILPKVLERWGESIQTGAAFEMEFPLRGADGVFRWFLTRVNPQRDPQGQIVRWFGTNTDIDQQRQTAEELREANRLKDEFLATLSHELRTPLTAILGWARMLQTNDFDNTDATRALQTIERNAQAQRQLIDDLLDTSRIITGKIRLDVRAVDLGSVVTATTDALRPAAEAKGIRLQTLLDPQAGPISGDPDRLQQVVWNLLSNAVKFTPKKGRIQVRLERVNSHVEITVSDTGKGIPPEFLAHVFDRFRQADQTSTRAHGGLGLGLAIVRQLVELHGGTVHAESPGEGQGATFVVSLPLLPVRTERRDTTLRQHPTAQTSVSLDCPAELGGLRVLVVDDERDTRELLNAVLTSCGAEVTLASSAAQAMEQIEQGQFDVLVTDIGMPEEDGFSLIAKVRQLSIERGGGMPAAALTAYARAEDRVRTLRSGFQMHVPKPVEPAELVAVIANLAGRTV